MIICLIWYTFQKLVLEYFSINIDNIASEKERKKRRRSYDPKKRSTKNGSDPLHDHGNDSSSRICGSSGAVPGWNQISGKWYYLMENGAWSTDFIEDENTCYTFTKDGTLSYARKTPNTQGGAYPVYVLDQKEQELFDDMNDEKSDLFFDTYPEAEDDYDNGDVEFYDGRATFVLDMDLCDIAKARLSSAMEKGYSKSKNTIPGEGTVSDYVKTAFPERKSATFFEMYLWGPEETYDPYDSVMIRMQEKFDRKDDKKYSLEYYRRMGIAHENQNGKDYYMVVLER